jgi:N utilization substance protein B
LRVASYEIRFIKTPKAVVISQALELGKKFGEKETLRFLNGVLDRIDA